MNEQLAAGRMRLLHPYVPGEQPDDRTYIKLNANENPYPPSPAVAAAVAELVKDRPQAFSLYPDPDSRALRSAVADMLNATGGVLCRAEICAAGGDAENRPCGEAETEAGRDALLSAVAAAARPAQAASGSGSATECAPAALRPSARDRIPFTVTPDMIYCGNGSDEVLSFVFYAFFDSGRRLVAPLHSYSFYPVYAGFYDIPLDPVPLRPDWSLDRRAMTERARANGSGMIFANPNAPTGRGLRRDEVREMLRDAPPDRAFVVDEAYVDFGGESCIPLLAEFDNLVIVRTFSKSLCGAGQRIGYVVASPEIVDTITVVKNSLNHFPLDAVAQTAGRAACRDAAYYAGCAKKIAAGRGRFSAFLEARGWEVIPSEANFVFARSPAVSGADVYRELRRRGILVRHFDSPGIEGFVRVTIGTDDQMRALERAVESL